MRIGGNDNAKKFFRKHGCTEKSACEKKYTSKAAVAYRAELAKAIDAEGAKRGEGVAVSSSGGNSSLLDNANATMQKSMEDEARSKLNAARSANGVNGEAGVLQPSAKLASQMSGAKGRLATPTGTPVPTPPVSGGLLKPPTKLNGGSGPKLVLRKPTSKTSASSRLLKKTSTSSTASKLRVNKITISGADDGFEDVETTQKNIVNQKLQEENEKKKREEEDAKLARELQEQLNGLGNGNEVAAAAPKSTTIPAINGVTSQSKPPVVPAAAAPPKPQVSAHEENMKKLSSMNSDFFSGL